MQVISVTVWRQDNLVGIVFRLMAGPPRNHVFIPGRGKRVISSHKACRPALGPIEPPTEWVSRNLSPGVKQP
jgi:hypothetical protein